MNGEMKKYRESLEKPVANTSQYLKNTDLKILPVNATHQAA